MTTEIILLILSIGLLLMSIAFMIRSYRVNSILESMIDVIEELYKRIEKYGKSK